MVSCTTVAGIDPTTATKAAGGFVQGVVFSCIRKPGFVQVGAVPRGGAGATLRLRRTQRVVSCEVCWSCAGGFVRVVLCGWFRAGVFRAAVVALGVPGRAPSTSTSSVAVSLQRMIFGPSEGLPPRGRWCPVVVLGPLYD